ncbi:hatching enzyme 1.2-like [Paramacrobiotus metropolitanus]|uniref:hatching enzyme 1.2-like n=1 Tax=Paramacrobiotus metropolitanus TaxID=2943436 RepID=UPI002446229E|nr:hatching enzyme 1.2-like [Paramacrobiotus metropolitanus]
MFAQKNVLLICVSIFAYCGITAADNYVDKSLTGKLSVQVGDSKRKSSQDRETFFGSPTIWLNATVPVAFAENLSGNETNALLDVLGKLESQTCLRFPVKSNEKNYTLFTKGPACAANVGMQGKRQYVFLSKGCFTPARVARQLMHVLGFHSELNRPDRDQYIEINWQNIRTGFVRSFSKYLPEAFLTLDFPFDFESVSHFDGNKFANDPDTWTVRSKSDPNEHLGSSNSFSASDMAKVNKIYCQSQLDNSIFGHSGMKAVR